MSIEEKAVFAHNGIKCQVAMFIKVTEADGEPRSDEEKQRDRDLLDALVMSLPLATALGITQIELRDNVLRSDLYVTLVPEVISQSEMFDQTSKIIEEGFEVFFEGEADDVHFVAAETDKASVYEPPKPLEGMSVPGRRIVLLDGEENG